MINKFFDGVRPYLRGVERGIEDNMRHWLTLCDRLPPDRTEPNAEPFPVLDPNASLGSIGQHRLEETVENELVCADRNGLIRSRSECKRQPGRLNGRVAGIRHLKIDHGGLLSVKRLVGKAPEIVSNWRP